VASKDDSMRRSADEIFGSVEDSGHQELRRSSRTLMFSGVAGGLGMGLTGLGVSSAMAVLGEGRTQEFISLMLYPLGFIAVIIGRQQLFTENTLYPVALILSEHKHVLDTLRLWTVVFVSNIAGATLFAFLAGKTLALKPEITEKLTFLGVRAAQGDGWSIFWSGVIGGWLIALMAWIVTASQWTIGQVAVVWALTFVVGLGHFAHCIASSGEILTAVMRGQVGVGHYAFWLIFATVGNVCGGVIFVTFLNFGQVHQD
jgi:formate-nitrite transporter family protein